MKKVNFVLVLLLISSVLFAGDFGFSFDLGYRESLTTTDAKYLALAGDFDDFKLGVSFQGNEEYNLSLSYDLERGKTLNNE